MGTFPRAIVTQHRTTHLVPFLDSSSHDAPRQQPPQAAPLQPRRRGLEDDLRSRY